MAVKAKRFRIAVEGATTDDRNISRDWIAQMAKNYSPEMYGARINMEHIRGYAADSTFRRFGDVTALEEEVINEGPLKDKWGLYAWIDPTPELVELTKTRQKIYTSIEVNPNFADTGEAYLVGLAVTDDPASLGTEMLAFSAKAEHNPLANRKQHKDNLFTAAVETTIEFEEVPEEKPSLFSRVTAMFAKKQHSDEARFSDVHQAVELLATEQQAFSQHTAQTLSEQASELQDLGEQLATQQGAFDELKAQLENTDSRTDYRQQAPGGQAPTADLTNC